MNRKELSLIISKKLDDERFQLESDFFKTNINSSTKHFVVDNLLPNDLVQSTFDAFPSKPMFHYKDSFRERKYTFAKLNQLDSDLPSILTDAFQSKEVIKSISAITKIPDLEGDPSLYAGGLSRMDKSHFLNPHIDNSHDSTRLRYRRLNILFSKYEINSCLINPVPKTTIKSGFISFNLSIEILELISSTSLTFGKLLISVFLPLNHL